MIRAGLQWVAAGFVALVILGACSALQAGVIAFPTRPVDPAAGQMAARATGTLDAWGGCLHVGAAPDGWVVVWPLGYRIDTIDGRLVVRDASGTLIAAVGDEVSLSGGWVDYDTIDGRTPRRLPVTCGQDPVFVASPGP